MILPREETLRQLPPPWADDLLPAIRRELQAGAQTLIVLDDDPTGTQTVYDLPVLTQWEVEVLRTELARGTPVFYVLTNSRSLPAHAAAELNRTIGQNIATAARRTGQAIAVVSRSDSTLRGHFPVETDALARGLGQQFDGLLLIPYFLEGGRLTIDDVHYVAEEDKLIPAGQTPFAADASFGYSASNLRAWVAEKTSGQIPADTVISITLDDLRRGGPDRVASRLHAVTGGAVCVVNATCQRDMEVLVLGLLRAEAAGKRFLYRTAASFVQTRAGLASRPLLTAAELALPAGGGLIVVGSYVPKSSGQLTHLLENTAIQAVEVDVVALLAEDAARAQSQTGEVARARQAVQTHLAKGRDVVLYTSRSLITGRDAEASLAIGKTISTSLVQIVRELTVRPRYLLAKGGITSSDLATAGLDIARGWVLGQILPGVPVWQAGPESRYPGLSYIVFPGNVGGPDALTAVCHTLTDRA